MTTKACGILQRNLWTYCRTARLRNQRQFARQILTSSRTTREKFHHAKLQVLFSRSLVTYSEVVEQYVQEVVQKHSELTSQLTDDESFKLSQNELHRISKELSSITPIVEVAKKMQQKREELQELEAMSQEEGELQELALKEKESCQQQIEGIQEEIMKSIIPRDQDDNSGALLEVRAGAGGVEASHFAEEIFEMYQRYCAHKGWRFELLETNRMDKLGYKNASACVTGSGAYGELKHESGVHRVQRVPQTDTNGRVHTSTISVAVLPQPEEVEIVINPKDLKFEAFKASGAGGQHVNKTSSSVRITHIPTNTIVSCQESKSQHENRKRALLALNAKLYNAQWSKQKNEMSTMRTQQIGTGERQEKIRTYNYSQERITDHRIGVSVFGIQEFLQGKGTLEDLISQLKSYHDSQALEQLLNTPKTAC